MDVIVFVSVGVSVDGGVRVGPNNFPGPQPEINRANNRLRKGIIRNLAFISILLLIRVFF